MKEVNNLKSKKIIKKNASKTSKSTDVNKIDSNMKLSLSKKGKRKSKQPVIPEEMEEVVKDHRFAHVVSDPRYRETSKIKRKVKLDSRFSSVLSDERFYEKCTMDPRGRPKDYSTKEDYKKFYHMSDDDSEDSSDEDDDEDEKGKEKNVEKKLPVKKADITQDFLNKIGSIGVDYARGESYFSSDSSLGDSSEEENDITEFEWAELDADATWNTEEKDINETSRFAVCNMDWDRIKAVDLLMLFSSFTPPAGSIKCVTIYPSEYGKDRLKEEQKHGPQELARMVSEQNRKKDDEDETGDATKNQLEILRKYQRNRLKYYYACVEFDSLETSSYVYKECDRQAFEGVGVCLDLRYIPDDMNFDQEPHDTCSSAPPNYECVLLTPNAIFASQPKLTWDETDPGRKLTLNNAMSKALNMDDIDDTLLKKYIASGSSNEDSSDEEDNTKDKEKSYAKFRSLIAEIDKKKKNSDVTAPEDESSGDENSATDDDDASGFTPFEQYLVKRKAKRKEIKKAKLEKKKEMEKILKGSESEESNSDDDGDDVPIPEDSDEYFEEDSKKEKQKKKKKKGHKVSKPSSDGEDEKNNKDLELLIMGENQLDGREHFSMRQIVEDGKKKSKRKLKQLQKEKMNEKKAKKITDDFQIDVSDGRFNTLLASGDFNIDPSHPNFKQTKQMDHLLETVHQKRIGEGEMQEKDDVSKNRILQGGVDIQSLNKRLKKSKR